MNSPAVFHLWKLTQIATLECKVNVISDAMQPVQKSTEILVGRTAFPAGVHVLGGKETCGEGEAAQRAVTNFS